MFKLMSLKDLAKELNKPESTIRTWRRRKDIPECIFVEIGGTVFVHVGRFQEWIDEKVA